MTRLTAIQVGSGRFGERAGGLNRYFDGLMRHLPDAGVKCEGFVVGNPPEADHEHDAVHAYARADASLFVRWRSGRRAVAAAWRTIDRATPAVLATHFAPYAFPLARPPSGRSTVVHFHGPWAAENAAEGLGLLRTAAKYRIERIAYRRADHFVVLSDAFRATLCRDYGVDAKDVTVVPGGVDVPRFAGELAVTKHAARRRLGWPTDRPVVLSVRRLAGRMGLENLIEAVALLRRRVPDVLCLVAGTGRHRDALAARILSADASECVRLIGFVADADLPSAYRAADVTVLPTLALEGFGLSAAESLAAGTPTLVSPVGGLPEVVGGLDPSLVLRDGTPETIADALAAALRGTTPLPSPEACAAHALQFDWPVVAGRVAAVYWTAITRNA